MCRSASQQPVKPSLAVRLVLLLWVGYTTLQMLSVVRLVSEAGSALLPAVKLLLVQRARLALVVHALLFGLWHIGPLFLGAPLWAVVAVMLVPFICGLGWGWEVQRDRTVVWAMVQHSMIWVIGSQFPPPS